MGQRQYDIKCHYGHDQRSEEQTILFPASPAVPHCEFKEHLRCLLPSAPSA